MLSKTSSALWAIERRALSLRITPMSFATAQAVQTYAILEALNVALQRQILRAAYITIKRRRPVIEGSRPVRSPLIMRSRTPVASQDQSRSISDSLHAFDVAMGFDRLGGLVESGEPTPLDKVWERLDQQEPVVDWREYRVCLESGDFDGAVRWLYAHQADVHAWNDFQLLRLSDTLHVIGMPHYWGEGVPERVWYVPQEHSLFARGSWQLDQIRVRSSAWMLAQLRKLADAQSRAEGHDPEATREEFGFSRADMMRAPISVRMVSHSLRNEVHTSADLADAFAMSERYDDSAWHAKRDDAPARLMDVGPEGDFKVGPEIDAPQPVEGPGVEDREQVTMLVERGGHSVIRYDDRLLAARQDRLYSEAYEDTTRIEQPSMDVTILDPAEHEARTQWALSALGQRPYRVEHHVDETLQAENLRRTIERMRREAHQLDLVA